MKCRKLRMCMNAHLLLIAPVGIEIWMRILMDDIFGYLLIAPVGIEIDVKPG